MNRSQLKETIQIPSLTPPRLNIQKTKTTKKNPLSQEKNKPSDTKNHLKKNQNTKAPIRLKKSNKTNTKSITPKTPKYSLHEKLFHNANLSETNVSAKYLENRRNSKINKSLINRLELTQKVKDIKKNTSPGIDLIIKKSLQKAKKRKLSQEKESKEHEFDKKIKKQEQLIQNRKIRLQNSLKYRRGKSRSKSRWDVCNNHANNTVKARCESSSRVRNCMSSLLIEPDNRNNRSVSNGDYYIQGGQRKSDPYILDYIDYKNHKRKEQDKFENLRKKAVEISKANRLKNLDKFTRNHNIKSPKECPRSINLSLSSSETDKNEENFVKRNISFIEDRNSEESISKESISKESLSKESLSKESLSKEDIEDDSNILDRRIISEYDIDSESVNNGRNHLIGQYSEESSEDARIKAACIIQKYFRKYLIRKYFSYRKNLKIQKLQDLKLKPCNLKAKNLKIQKLQDLELKPCNLKAKNLKVQAFQTKSFIPIKKEEQKIKLTLEKNQKIMINPIKKFNLCINSLIKDRISIKNIKKKSQLSNEGKLKISPKISNKDKEKDSNPQFQDQIEWNSAQIYIIEQLRLSEITDFSEYFNEISSNKHKEIIDRINSKYKSLLKVLKQRIEISNLDILEKLSLEEYTLFEHKTQAKQQLLHKTLLEAYETSLKGDFTTNLPTIPIEYSEVGTQPLESLSSEDKNLSQGINHSKSLSQLLEEAPHIKSNKNSNKKDSNVFPVFFDIEDNIEVQNVNLLADELTDGSSRKSLPGLSTLPMLHLDLMQQEVMYSDPRILTSAEFILDYIKNIFSFLNFDTIIQEISQPIRRNIEKELIKLQEKDFGTPAEVKIYEFPLLFDIEKLLTVDTDENELETTIRQINEADKIHKKMLLQLVNYFLQQFRPYGYAGEPLPWSSKQRTIKKKINASIITAKICKDFEIFSMFQAGRIFNDDILTSKGGADEELIEGLREERLDRLLFFELYEEEQEWIDFEYEETQTKLDLSDMILETLAEELINILD